MIKSVVKQKNFLEPKEIIMCYIIFGMKNARWYRGDITELKDKILF